MADRLLSCLYTTLQNQHNVQHQRFKKSECIKLLFSDRLEQISNRGDDGCSKISIFVANYPKMGFPWYFGKPFLDIKMCNMQK